MPRPKSRSPEQFVAESPIGDRFTDEIFEHHLASGALRLIEINSEPQKLDKPGNKEVKTQLALESGYFGIINQNPDFIKAEINDLVIKGEEVPESYYKLQQRIARERGQGDLEITDELRRLTAETLREDQAASLVEWSDYLRSDENGHIYPDWFKVYVWESLKKMGEFDKEKGKFKKRTRSTTAPWPELNAEALSYVYDAINNGVIQGNTTDGERLSQLLKTGNFAALYAHALFHAEASVITPEMREIIKGSWVKYDQIEGEYNPDYDEVNGEFVDDTTVDNSTVTRLAESLRGKNTGWCTAGTRTAAYQLSMGDFYVYYTRDNEGKDTIPRVAIRMENGRVAEVRGIEADQNLEGCMTDIVAEKLKTLPGGDKYFKKVEDMRRLTEIDERFRAGGEITTEDMIFLQFNKVCGFGWYEDPRVSDILESFKAGSVIDILKNKIGYDELYRLTIESNGVVDDRRIDDSIKVILDGINKLNDNNKIDLVRKINNRNIPLYYEYRDLVDHSGALFAAGVSVTTILENACVLKRSNVCGL